MRLPTPPSESGFPYGSNPLASVTLALALEEVNSHAPQRIAQVVGPAAGLQFAKVHRAIEVRVAPVGENLGQARVAVKRVVRGDAVHRLLSEMTGTKSTNRIYNCRSGAYGPHPTSNRNVFLGQERPLSLPD